MESQIKVVRSRRRSLSLTVDHEGQVIIKAPNHIKNEFIVDFVKQKKRWIQKNLAKVQVSKERVKTIDLSKEKLAILKSRSQEILSKETQEVGARMNLVPANIKTTSARTLWGSCTVDNIVRLNWRLLLVPQECREYVIIHELAHITHKNHSGEFWNLVGQHCTNYKELRQKLKEYSYLLKST